MKYLVPDTNVFVQDFRLEGNSFRAFLENYTAVADRVLIPKVVYQEHLSNYTKRLDTELKKLTENYKNICRLVGDEIQEPKHQEMGELIKLYEGHVKKTLKAIDYDIVDYPPVSLEIIARKAISRLKPFKKGGEGYCDALIWETILHILRSNKDCEVIFITNNINDFFNGESIHEELTAELIENGIAPHRIVVYRTLKDVVDNLLLNHLDSLDNLKQQINTNTVPGINIDEWMSGRLFDLITEDDAGLILGGLSSDDCTLHLSEIYEVSSVRADEARVLSANDKYLTLTAHVGLSIEVCADYHQYEGNADIEELFNHWHTQPAPYACVTKSGNVEAKMSVVIQGNDLMKGKVELITLTGDGGTVNYDNPRKPRSEHSYR
jgi:predicted nucleic acid-binding protein